MTDLGSLGDLFDSEAFAINEQGVIVGLATDREGLQPVVWTKE
jgi:uncharacterized membrane protein